MRVLKNIFLECFSVFVQNERVIMPVAEVKIPYWPLNTRPLGTNFFLNFWSSGPGKKRPGNIGPGKIKGRLKVGWAKLKAD